jgi:hypothetical protein
MADDIISHTFHACPIPMHITLKKYVCDVIKIKNKKTYKENERVKVKGGT